MDLEQFASQPPYEEALAAAANQHEVAEEPRQRGRMLGTAVPAVRGSYE